MQSALGSLQYFFLFPKPGISTDIFLKQPTRYNLCVCKSRILAYRRVTMSTVLNQEILNRFLNQKMENSDSPDVGESLKKVALDILVLSPVQQRSWTNACLEWGSCDHYSEYLLAKTIVVLLRSATWKRSSVACNFGHFLSGSHKVLSAPPYLPRWDFFFPLFLVD